MTGPNRRTWQHQPGDRYVLMVGDIVGNEMIGFRTEYTPYYPVQGSIEQAWRKGLRELARSDDFNLGVLRDGSLVALLWFDEVVDDDPAVLADVAERSGL